MLKVNESLLLKDYEVLLDKKATGRTRIEDAARIFAETRGYDKEKASEFVEYVLHIEGGGLSDEEEKKLDFLAKYVYEVSDEVENAEEAEEEVEEENIEVVRNDEDVIN